jgi:hypothetical protein
MKIQAFQIPMSKAGTSDILFSPLSAVIAFG